MHVVQVTNLALQSELFLRTWCYGAEFAVRHYLPDNLPLCGVTFLNQVFSSRVNSTHVTQRFEMGFLKMCHHKAEESIKNQLLHNCSLFTTACPPEIRLLYLEEKPVTSSLLY